MQESAPMNHCSPLRIGSAALACILHLWNNHKMKCIISYSLFSLGGAYFYRYYMVRDKVTSNHLVVITGCDSGLGYSLALYCRQLGAVVIAGVYDESCAAVEILKKQHIMVFPLDLTEKKSVKHFMDAVENILETNNLTLHTFINNAGIMVFGEFEWQTEEQTRQQVEVNFLGTMTITREFLPLIRKHSSRIIIISSHCAIESLPGVSIYSGTKAAISAWAVSIRVELKKYGIEVVHFVPGSFTKESNILKSQMRHFEKMRLSMSAEARHFYGDYFNNYANYFEPMVHDASPRVLTNPRIYEIFKGALLDKYPSAIYKYEPWRYFFYYTLFKYVPTHVRDRLAERFIRMPSWKKQTIKKI